MTRATLHLLCGKIASGKSTLAATLGAAPDTIVIAEDHWLSQLYPDQQHSLADYVRNAGRLRAAMGPHIVALLRLGVSAALDFPANTVASRAWMRTLFDTAGAPHRLHLLDTDDAVCRARMHRRNAAGMHPYQPSDADFDRFTRHFAPPTADEGFELVVHPADAAPACGAVAPPPPRR